MKLKLLILLSIGFLVNCNVIASMAFTQDMLELWMYSERDGIDDLDAITTAVDVPMWNRDAIKKYQVFITEGQWTTNRLIDAFILAVTNHLYASTWPSEKDEAIARIALINLSEINLPRAKSFVVNLCTNDVKTLLGCGVSAVYAYSHLEPEVFDYLYRLCVMTNRYSKVVGQVAMDIEKCLVNVPDAQKPAATNRVAKYHYFVLNHSVADMGLVDGQLSRLIPSYANSIQRLRAMRHITNTTTNSWVKQWTREEAERLEALPTNALNNVQWLEE